MNTDNTTLKRLVASGNRKLPRSTAIFNMTSATDCVSRKLGLCNAMKCGIRCYALKAEVQYPCVLPYRSRQATYWDTHCSAQFAGDLLAINERKRKPFTHLRLNEAGDFRSQADVDKTENIAKMLKMFGIVVYCYTSRSDLDFSGCDQLVINGSGFKTKGITNKFSIIDNKASATGKVCPGNCRICKRCSVRGSVTQVVKH